MKPLVIDYDDPEYAGAGERLGGLEYEDFVAQGDADQTHRDAVDRRHVIDGSLHRDTRFRDRQHRDRH